MLHVVLVIVLQDRKLPSTWTVVERGRGVEEMMERNKYAPFLRYLQETGWNHLVIFCYSLLF